MLERAFGDIAAGGYRSRGLEKPVLERTLSRYIAAGGYRSSGLEKAVLSVDVAAGGYISRGLEWLC